MSFFVVERVKESLRGVREVELVPEPGHFSFIKAENSQGQVKKKKNKRHVFHLCFEVKFNIFFYYLFTHATSRSDNIFFSIL